MFALGFRVQLTAFLRNRCVAKWLVEFSLPSFTAKFAISECKAHFFMITAFGTMICRDLASARSSTRDGKEDEFNDGDLYLRFQGIFNSWNKTLKHRKNY